MSTDRDRYVHSPGGWLRGAIIVVVVAAILGVFGRQSALQKPQWSVATIAGLVVMLLGLFIAWLPRRKGKGSAAGDVRLSPLIGVVGVMICGVGAALVFIA